MKEEVRSISTFLKQIIFFRDGKYISEVLSNYKYIHGDYELADPLTLKGLGPGSVPG